MDGYAPGSWKATDPTLGRRNTDTINGADYSVLRECSSMSQIRTSRVRRSPCDVRVTGSTLTVIINEVRNDTSPANVDWVELYNAGTEPVGLWDWELTLLKDDGGDDLSKTDTVLVGWDKPDIRTAAYAETSFPKNEDFKLQPGEYLLIVNRDPSLRSVACEWCDIDAAIAGREVKAGATHQYIVRPKLDLAEMRVFRLCLEVRLIRTLGMSILVKRKSQMRGLQWIRCIRAINIMDFVGNYPVCGEDERIQHASGVAVQRLDENVWC